MLIYQNHFRSSSFFVSSLFDKVGGISLQEKRKTSVSKTFEKSSITHSIAAVCMTKHFEVKCDERDQDLNH